MTQPYLDEYRPEPFSRRFVRHLPGWYAQKHPDEDWAETFAVWMTPASTGGRGTPTGRALAKLEYCDRVVGAVAVRDPVITDEELDEDVGQIGYSIQDLYQHLERAGPGLPRQSRRIAQGHHRENWNSEATISRKRPVIRLPL